MTTVHIDEFTDPSCPFAWSAEPIRRRLRWRYGDAIAWRPRMIVLSESPADHESRGLTTAMIAGGWRRLGREHGMPMITRERERLPVSLPACRTVVAVRERRSPEEAAAVLRRIRIHNFSGEFFDEPAVLASAVAEAGLDPDEVAGWAAEADVERALRDDMDGARQPTPAARALDDKLASWAGGRRYTCPTYEIRREADDAVMTIPGFQPLEVYEVVLANVLPEVELRGEPEDVAEVLAWAGEPLATREVAVVCGIDHADARERLGQVAVEAPLGPDGFWTLRG